MSPATEVTAYHSRDTGQPERPELFVLGETVHPGFLVLVNNADWELLGELEYEIQEGDNVVFISTEVN